MVKNVINEYNAANKLTAHTITKRVLPGCWLWKLHVSLEAGDMLQALPLFTSRLY